MKKDKDMNLYSLGWNDSIEEITTMPASTTSTGDSNRLWRTCINKVLQVRKVERTYILERQARRFSAVTRQTSRNVEVVPIMSISAMIIAALNAEARHPLCLFLNEHKSQNGLTWTISSGRNGCRRCNNWIEYELNMQANRPQVVK